jgi:hypothetical protein
MKAFWNGLAKALAKGAIWCADHPQVVEEVINAAIAAKA